MGDPDRYVKLGDDSALFLVDKRHPAFNTLVIGPEQEAARVLRDGLDILRTRGYPATVQFAESVASALHPEAERHGLTLQDKMPVMVFRPTAALPFPDDVEVQAAGDAVLLRSAMEVITAVTELPLELLLRVTDRIDDVECFIGSKDGEIMSTVTLTRLGDTALISAMVTLPAHQRKGVGRALLSRAIELYRTRGVQRFFLSATPAGFPMYERLGFKTISHHEHWSFEPAS
ncbi:MAG TPA: GNAT family N-acetyltransferase [Aliidongia sp.]|nr:GNAT family N-acetyltransferase [Aliidongia sp.]